MAELEATGKMTPRSRTDLGRIGLGVVIRDGAAVPDVSTPEALKQLLIRAKSIAYTDPKLGGTSVLIVVGVALDTMRQMESQMMMRHYEGFLR